MGAGESPPRWTILLRRGRLVFRDIMFANGIGPEEGVLLAEHYLYMASKKKPSFDPKSFLTKVGEGRNIGNYRKDQIVFSQGDPANAVFYIQSGKIKVTVVSEQGKEAVVAILRAGQFFR